MSATTAKFPSKCQRCGLKVQVGDTVTRIKIDGWVHEDCDWANYTHQIDAKAADGWDARRLVDWLWAGQFNGVDNGLLRNRLLEYVNGL